MTTAANGSAAAADGGKGGDAAAAAAAAAAAGNPDAGADKSAAPGNGSAENKGAASPWDGLQRAENRDLVKAKGWTGIDTLADSYRELEGKLGKAVVPPANDAPAEQLEAFYEKLGRPKTPGEYKFERPKGLPEKAPYDVKAVAQMSNLMHAAGLTPRQASLVHDAVVTTAWKATEAKQASEVEAIGKEHQSIVKEWGEPDGAKYKRQSELTRRAIVQTGGDALMADMKALGVLAEDGSVKRAPHLVFALAKIGEQLYAEDELWGQAGGFVNPFADATEDKAEQGRIIKQDPDRARALIRNAGIDPKDYGL